MRRSSSSPPGSSRVRRWGKLSSTSRGTKTCDHSRPLAWWTVERTRTSPGSSLGGRVHPVNVAGQEQVGDQPFEAVVLGGQERELLDVGDAVVGPLVLEPDRGRITPLEDGADRRGGVAFRVGRPELLEVAHEPREEALALGRQECHRLGRFERLERPAALRQVLKDRRRPWPDRSRARARAAGATRLRRAG